MSGASRVRLDARLVTPPLPPGRAGDFAVELTLTNEGERAIVVCAKEARLADPYGLPHFGVAIARAGAGEPLAAASLLLNPAWGAPSPPSARRYLKEHGRRLAPARSVVRRVSGCLVPSAFAEATALVAFDARADELALRLATDGQSALFGSVVAFLRESAGLELHFSYLEQPAFGFEPEHPLLVCAPPLALVRG